MMKEISYDFLGNLMKTNDFKEKKTQWHVALCN